MIFPELSSFFVSAKELLNIAWIFGEKAENLQRETRI
jgi:hypothetical protein